MPLAIMFYFILVALAGAVIGGACAAFAGRSGARIMQALNVAVIVLFFLLWIVFFLGSRG